MNTKVIAEQFREDGYVLVANFFADELMNHLDSVIRNHFGDNPDFGHNDEFLEKSKTEVVPWFPHREGVHDFDVIENDHRLQALSEAVLGPDWYTQYCMVMFSKKGTVKVRT